MPVYPADGVADFPYKITLDVVRWVLPGWYMGSVDSKVLTAGRIYYTPFFVEQTTTYIRIGVEVTAGAAGDARLGIHNWNAGLPGTLVLDAGTVDTTAIAVKEIVIAQQLTRGYYFTALVCDAAPTCVAIHRERSSPPLAGFFTSFQITLLVALSKGGEAAQVAGGLSDPAAVPTDGVGINDAPMVLLREN